MLCAEEAISVLAYLPMSTVDLEPVMGLWSGIFASAEHRESASMGDFQRWPDGRVMRLKISPFLCPLVPVLARFCVIMVKYPMLGTL
jgi:hypothetical protein